MEGVAGGSTSKREYARLEKVSGVSVRSKISNTCTYLFVRVRGEVLMALRGLRLLCFLFRRFNGFLDAFELALARRTTWRVLTRPLLRRLAGFGRCQYEVRVVVSDVLPCYCEDRVEVDLRDTSFGRRIFALALAVWRLPVWIVILVVEQFLESDMKNK